MGKKPNIMIFIMDTQRVDNLSCYGYAKKTTPNLERIAEEGTLFLNNITPAVWTLPSHASLFTGMYQSSHGAGASCDFLPGRPATLAEVLSSESYRTVAFFGNEWAAITGKGFKEICLVKKVDPENPDKGSLHRARMVIDWLERNYDGKEPFFMFVQFMEPHLRCWPPEPFRSKFLLEDVTEDEARKVNQDPNLVRAGKVRMSKRDWAILRSLYDGETATLDHRIGLILDYMRERDILDRTLLIVTADHGDMRGEHDYMGRFQLMGHHLCVYEELIHVPLIVRYPEIFPPGIKVDALVQTLDIFPTIVELLGIRDERLEGQLQGRSLLPTLRGEHVREWALTEYQKSLLMSDRVMMVDPDVDFRMFNRWLKSYRTLRYKYIWASDGRDELYDLSEDPGERCNLVDEMPEKVKEMRRQLESFLLSLEMHDYGDKLHSCKKAENLKRLKAWGFYREIERWP